MTPRSTAALAGAALALTTLATASHAQTTRPEAGSLLQQIEQGQQPRLPQARKPAVAPTPDLKPAGDLAVTVSRFRFAGNRLLDDARLQATVAPWLGRPLDFSELQKAALAVAAAYRDAGWVVRAFLPRQEIDGGVVTIQVIEAVFGALQIDAADGLRLPPDAARRIVLTAQPTGQPLSADAIDRALLLLEDLPGLSVRGDLKEGKGDAETDLLLRLAPLPLFSGEVSADNSGSRSTGAGRLNGTLYAGSPLRLGDQASANLIHTEGSDYWRGAWSLPLGSRGLRAEVNHSSLRYRVVTPEFAGLDAKGHSETSGLSLSYPIVRSRTRNLYANLALDHKRYFNESNAAVVSDYAIDTRSLGLSGVIYDEWRGGGASAGGLTFVSGRVNLAGSPNQASDAAGPRTHGSYQKLKYSASRQQYISPDITFYGALNGQLADRNLDSGEKFYLGGMSGVRAYPASEAGGADGQIINLELRYRLPANLALSAFYDWGQVQVNHDNGFPNAAAKNSLTLQGAGVSVGWAGPYGSNVKLTWARRIGSNPNPTQQGNDQDGTRHLNRFWLWGNLAF